MKLIEELGMMFPNKNSKKKYRYGLYECPVCKKHFKTTIRGVKRGQSSKCKSCATVITNTTHGFSRHPLYHTWSGERRRCEVSTDIGFKYYGARGISISEEFKDFKKWLEYVESLPNAYKENYSIDRIDNDGNYERGNLRWASKQTQCCNTRMLIKSNKTGYRGVSVHKNKFKASISVNKKSINIGFFDDAKKAAVARDSYVVSNNLQHTLNNVLMSSL